MKKDEFGASEGNERSPVIADTTRPAWLPQRREARKREPNVQAETDEIRDAERGRTTPELTDKPKNSESTSTVSLGSTQSESLQILIVCVILLVVAAVVVPPWCLSVLSRPSAATEELRFEYAIAQAKYRIADVFDGKSAVDTWAANDALKKALELIQERAKIKYKDSTDEMRYCITLTREHFASFEPQIRRFIALEMARVAPEMVRDITDLDIKNEDVFRAYSNRNSGLNQQLVKLAATIRGTSEVDVYVWALRSEP